MLKTTNSKKLSLNKNSLRKLTSTELGNAVGRTGDTCLLTPTCDFVCKKPIMRY
jgi:hypothetical protein